MRRARLAAAVPLWLLLTSCHGERPRAPDGARPEGPPRIWAVAVTNIRPTAVRISWTTDRPTTTELVYAAGGLLASRFSVRGEGATRIHSVTLDGLKIGREYRFRVVATDEAGRRAQSEWGRFTPRRIAVRDTTKFSGVTILGACCGIPEATLAAGMHADRFDSGWDGLVPRPGQWDQTRLDDYAAKIRDFRKAGIETVITLDYCVGWARRLTDTQASWRHPAFGPPDSLKDWKEFCRGLMRRLNDLPQWYEVWNEPDAGYLATPLGPGGKQRKAPEEWRPVIDPLFQNNTRYWIQDRYAPLIFAAREVADQVGGDIRLMAPAWNHDFHGGRGELLFQVGVHRLLDAYSFHCYAGKPLCYEAWRKGFETYIENIDRIFNAHSVALPLAMTEYGYENFQLPEGDKSLVSPEDRAVQIAKSTLLALSKHRFLLLVAFPLAGGAMGMAEEPSVPLKPRPMLLAYKHLVDRFSRKRYERFDALSVRAEGNAAGELLAVVTDPALWCHAFRFPATGEVFVAAWQGQLDAASKLPAELPARTLSFRVPPPAPLRAWALFRVDLAGGERRAESRRLPDGGIEWRADLPATRRDREAEPTYHLLRPVPE